jgi:hypothetical protein
LLAKVRLEPLDLFDMKLFEVAKSGIGFETVECLGDAVDRTSFRPFASLSQMKYSRLIRSFGALDFFMRCGPLPKLQFREG